MLKIFQQSKTVEPVKTVILKAKSKSNSNNILNDPAKRINQIKAVIAIDRTHLVMCWKLNKTKMNIKLSNNNGESSHQWMNNKAKLIHLACWRSRKYKELIKYRKSTWIVLPNGREVTRKIQKRKPDGWKRRECQQTHGEEWSSLALVSLILSTCLICLPSRVSRPTRRINMKNQANKTGSRSTNETTGTI